MANVTKPPILDGTGQTIKQKLSEILAALQSSGGSYIPLSQKGAASGVAELDANGKVPSAQLPSYVDDVLEYASLSNFPATGESGKIYIAVDTNKSYRWSGSTYVEISSSLALGETSSTAYRGDRGKTAYDHATESGKISAAVASGLYKIAATAQGHIAGLTAVQKSDLTALGVADANDIPTITDTYDGTSSDGMSGKAVKSAIDALDGAITGSAGAGKTLTAFSQTDGKVSATFANISITKSQISDFPTIPTVNNATLTIQKNGTTVKTFTANASSDVTANITVPTKTSDLTNDSGFITSNLITGVKGDAESTYRTGNVNITAANVGAVKYRGNLNTIGSGTPIAAAKTYWTDNVSNYDVNIAYNNSGAEYTIIFSRGGSNKYGTILKYGYTDKYMYIARNNNGTWQANDWEKMNAGYADTAGSATKASQNASGTAFGDLATINKGSGSSKFLREDGTWQTVSVSWSGGAVSSNIYPSTNYGADLGTSSKKFMDIYAQNSHTDYVYAELGGQFGKANDTDGTVVLYQNNSSYPAYIQPSETAYTGFKYFYLPTKGGTLLTNSSAYEIEDYQDVSMATNLSVRFYLFRNGVKGIFIASSNFQAAAATYTNKVPAKYQSKLLPDGTVYFTGFCANYNSTSGVSRARGGAIQYGNFYVYTGATTGWWVTHFYV